MKTVLRDNLIRSKNALIDKINKIINLVPDPKKKIESDAYKFWNESRDDARLKDLSHHKGYGRWSVMDEWYKIGTDHLEMVNNLCKFLDREKPIRYILEWGPGGGANAVQFSQNAEMYYGVDISDDNLNQCTKELNNIGFKNFIPLIIDIDNPESCLNFLDNKVDLFLSTAVYQHFPSKEYGIRITELAEEILCDDGIALIQIRYETEKFKYKPKSTNYRQNAVYFTSYKLDEFWSITEKAGLRPHYIKLNPKVNYAYYLITKG